MRGHVVDSQGLSTSYTVFLLRSGVRGLLGRSEVLLVVLGLWHLLGHPLFYFQILVYDLADSAATRSWKYSPLLQIYCVTGHVRLENSARCVVICRGAFISNTSYSVKRVKLTADLVSGRMGM